MRLGRRFSIVGRRGDDVGNQAELLDAVVPLPTDVDHPEGVGVLPAVEPIKYVVVDDTKSTQDRVTLAHDDPESYDASYYETQLIRAVESLLSPLGWDRTDIHRALNGHETPELTMFEASQTE